MELSEIINLVLGGGLMTTIVAIVNMKSTVREAKAKANEAKANETKAIAEAETVRIDNTEKATRILIENIVEPLKAELDETRRAMQLTKREMARLRKAIDTANSCKHHDDCPVLLGMRKSSEGARDEDGYAERTADRQPRARSQTGADAADTNGTGESDTDEGQPP